MRSKIFKLIILLTVTLLWATSGSPIKAVALQKIPAFPGAVGAGAMTPGGRGGRVIEVTNLNDSGTGSLRAAVTASGARIVVFRIGGTINLQSPLTISNPYLTIAGQTAPGGGITVKNATVRIKTHNIIIRYLRFRPGAATTADPSSIDGLDIVNNPSSASDTNKMVHDLIIDHCSFSWAVDENLSLWNTGRDINKLERVTIQNSIISEGLSNNIHPDGKHSKGLLVGAGSEYITIYHNLFAHNDDRNPLIQGGHAEVVNNVMYNGKRLTSEVAWTVNPDSGVTYLNYISNYEKKGPNSPNYHMLLVQPNDWAHPERHYGHQIYVKGNIGTFRTATQTSEWAVVGGGWGQKYTADKKWQIFTPHVFPGVPVPAQDAQSAYSYVLANAGASLVRDAVDQRIVNEVKNRTGYIIDSPTQVGGWPTLAAGTPLKDSDHDGIPNSWETSMGLDPNSSTDMTKDSDGDGYTNVEEYLNSIITQPANSEPPIPQLPQPTVEPTVQPTPDTIKLVLNGPTSARTGETFGVTAHLQNLTSQSLYGAQLEINFDPNLISVHDLKINPDLSFIVRNTVDPVAGKITLAASRQGKVPGLTGDVLLLTFDATAANTAGRATFTTANQKFGNPQAAAIEVETQDLSVSIEGQPTPEPTDEPTPEPTAQPTSEPTGEPTSTPTSEPTSVPTVEPTGTPEPTSVPTVEPTSTPTSEPTGVPTSEPTVVPTVEPTGTPSPEPTGVPTSETTPQPTQLPTFTTLKGQVILAGRAGNNWADALVTLADSEQSTVTDPLGNYSLANVTAGLHSAITADAPGYLPAVCTNPTLTSPEATLTAVTLLSGDINDDAKVDAVDATTIGVSFGNTGSDLPADITRDNTVDIFDIILVSINFGQGQQVWTCQAEKAVGS